MGMDFHRTGIAPALVKAAPFFSCIGVDAAKGRETISLTREASREIICSNSLTEDAYNEELATTQEHPQTATAIQHLTQEHPGKRTARGRFSRQENVPWRGGRFDDGGGRRRLGTWSGNRHRPGGGTSERHWAGNRSQARKTIIQPEDKRRQSRARFASAGPSHKRRRTTLPQQDRKLFKGAAPQRFGRTRPECLQLAYKGADLGKPCRF